jgi:2-iminobutanoate/2-iminopropanoate deaminase
LHEIKKINIIGKNDLAKQTQKSIDNIKIVVNAAGGNLANIVMLRIYKVDFQKEDGPIIAQILKDNFGVENPPASTWISVKGLANEEFMIEVEAQAVI